MKKVLSSFSIILLACSSLLLIPGHSKADADISVTFNPVTHTHDRYPALSGTVDDPAAEVVVYVSDESTTAGINATNQSDGTWTINAGDFGPFADGIYDVYVEARDNDLVAFGSNDYPGGLTVLDDFIAPPELTLSSVDGSNQSSYIVSGTVEADSFVHVIIEGQFAEPVENTTSANSLGNFTFPPFDLSGFWDGELIVKAQAMDPSDNLSVEKTWTITKSAGSLLMPVLTGIDEVNWDNQHNYNLTGGADPGATVYYFMTDSAGIPLNGTVVADDTGSFTAQLDLSGLANGDISVIFGQRLGSDTSVLDSAVIAKNAVDPGNGDTTGDNDNDNSDTGDNDVDDSNINTNIVTDIDTSSSVITTASATSNTTVSGTLPVAGEDLWPVILAAVCFAVPIYIIGVKYKTIKEETNKNDLG